jgi:hypothetical protein
MSLKIRLTEKPILFKFTFLLKVILKVQVTKWTSRKDIDRYWMYFGGKTLLLQRRVCPKDCSKYGEEG